MLDRSIGKKMTNSGQKLERKVKDILEKTVGKTFSWKNKQFTLRDWGKPMGQKTGETDRKSTRLNSSHSTSSRMPSSA